MEHLTLREQEENLSIWEAELKEAFQFLQKGIKIFNTFSTLEQINHELKEDHAVTNKWSNLSLFQDGCR